MDNGVLGASKYFVLAGRSVMFHCAPFTLDTQAKINSSLVLIKQFCWTMSSVDRSLYLVVDTLRLR